MVSPPILSAMILAVALLLFVSEKVRHDLVALIALLAAVLTGLVKPAQAFGGFADPAVISVAAILVIGRAIELSGVAGAIARVAVPTHMGFTVRTSGLLVVAAILSAFMNNIAALVITMPIATEIARDAKKPPAATLMPLAFATILGGMTTLIGTPANLILSSVREEALGKPFGFFTMAPVGTAVCIIGLGYLATIGWRFLPIRRSAMREARPPWRVYELVAAGPAIAAPVAPLRARLRAATARAVGVFRAGEMLPMAAVSSLEADDRLLVVGRQNQWVTAELTGLVATAERARSPQDVTARVVVAHGSFLIGLSHEAVRIRSDGAVTVVAAGAAVARRRVPLSRLRIEAGDQLFLRGSPDALAHFLSRARLLEVDRIDPAPVATRRAMTTVAVFALAIAAIVVAGVSPSLAFVSAAVFIAAGRLIPPDEIYRSIDWSIVILLAAMIPVGQAFQSSGAAAIAAQSLSDALTGMPLIVVLAALCALTLLLSIFLNNVATAVIMGPLAIDAARLLGVSPDAALLAVLIGASSDFLTPIGHQNNLLVMGPGGYRFSDYARMGAPLVVIAVATTAIVLALGYGT
ncbi:MAG: SLC13 family permease [Sphingomonas sp.]|jgi:di/tricarboxylate transporter|uniref:SLC13 family permease n=1 Tax=Sphingomonas sp. TaxID=28214 RepID=UPI003565EDBB